MNRSLLIVVGIVLWLVGCKPGTPSEYIQPDEMEDILVDYHMAKAMAEYADEEYGNRSYQQALFIEAVMQKHGVTKAEFDSSLVYYYRRADRFTEIYERVAERLEEQALVLGATEGEIGKFASLSNSGDTANIWVERSTNVMAPIPPYNRWMFEVEVDSAFHSGDSFLIQFISDFMCQDGVRSAVLYVALTYDNDTTISRNMYFSSGGLTQMRIPEYENHIVKGLRGYFYFGGGSERTSTTRLLFFNNIQLIRFHSKQYEETQKDSIESDSLGRQLSVDTLSGRSIQRSGDKLLPIDTRDAKHRMVRRPDMFEAR